jgi:arsenite-transporting ATPase
VTGAAACAYRFYGGKGGVGKTTCAAAAALGAAEAGRRVLVVSTDPAHSLGDALAVPLGSRPRRVPTRRGWLHAVELDGERALTRWLRPRGPALRAIAERGTYLDGDDVGRLLQLGLPGVDELVGLVELVRLARAGRYDHVVVDTAPTGHTLRLLEMPETIRRLAAILDQLYARHRFLAARLAGEHRPDASDALIAELDAEGRGLQALLRDPARAAFRWVLLPETLALEEAGDGVDQLARGGITVGEVVVNRVTPRPSRPCSRCAARRRAEGPVIRRIARRFGGRLVRFLPALPAEPRGIAALRPVARRLAAVDRGAALVAGPNGLAARGGRGPAAAPGGAWLEAVAPAESRLLLVAGKGGVGKSTCAAALALALAADGRARPVLLLSTDPAHSLGDVLATPIGDAACRPAGAPRGLSVRELDAARAFHARRERYRAAVEELFGAGRSRAGVDAPFDREALEELIDLAPPGVDELFAVLSVVEALAAPAVRVVVDTAPTGHTLRLLALPAVALQWVQALLAILLRYRAILRPGRLAGDLVALARDLRRLQGWLTDGRRTRVLVVTRAGELPRRETERFRARLAALGITVGAVIVNAVPVAGAGVCRACRAAAAEAARAVARLRARGARPAGTVVVAPEALPPPRGVGPLGGWSRTWRLGS